MRSYYSFVDQKGFHACSIASDEYPLIVNCTGNMETSFPFTTDNPTGREDYYLLYMVKGRMTLLLPAGERIAEPGCVLLLPPRYPYRYVFCAEEPLSYFWVHFTGSYAARLLEECGLRDLPLCFDAPESHVAERFRSLFHRIETPEPFLKKELACALEQLLLSVARAYADPERNRPLEISMRHIHAFYHRDLRVPDLAKMENLSNSRYVALFREQNGISPMGYIVGLRIRTACELLQGTDMTVKQIAYQVGYEDPFFFSKLFKKHTGVSPSAYRHR